MKRLARWLQLTAGLAIAFVAVSSIVAAIRQGSWEPIASVGWLPAVIVAAWPGTYRRTYRRCLARRSGQLG